MAVHNIQHELEIADFKTDGRPFNTPEGIIHGWGKSVGLGIEGWSPGAKFVHTDGAGITLAYHNIGTKTTAVWVRDAGLSAGEYFSMVGTSYLSLADDAYIRMGTGQDIKLMWNGTYLEGGPATGLWANAPSEADPRWHQFAYKVFDDFDRLDTTATVGDWAAYNVGTGTTTRVDDVAGGELLMTCQATTDDACEQLSYTSAPFLLAAGKTLWYEARVKQVGDVQSEVSFGLSALGEDLTAVADVYPEDGVCFAHQDGSMALALTCSKNGTDTGAVAAVHTMVTGVYATYGLLIDGITSVTPYINGTAGTPATATINDDESMCPYFLVRNGDGTTQQKLHVDYAKCIQLR